MTELYYFLSTSIILLIILGYTAYQDFKNKLIYLYSFYLLNIIGLIWLYNIKATLGIIIMLAYFIIIIILDFLEYFKKLPSFIDKYWMIGETGIYDYWIYLFIISIFITFIPINFAKYYILFSLSIIFGSILAFTLTNKKYKKNIPLFVYGFFIILFLIITISQVKYYMPIKFFHY